MRKAFLATLYIIATATLAPARAIEVSLSPWMFDHKIQTDNFLYGTDEIETIALHLEGDIKNGDALKIKETINNTNLCNSKKCEAYVSISSKGGSISEAIKIGSYFRELNSHISIEQGSLCISSCILIYASGVRRYSDGVLGVHRPYLDKASPDADFAGAYKNIRSALETYFENMRVSKGIVDLMYSIPPEKVYNLTKEEANKLIPNTDPVYDEKFVAIEAARFGISSSQFRERNSADHSKCIKEKSDIIQDWLERDITCRAAKIHGLSLEVYIDRKALSRKLCASSEKDKVTDNDNMRRCMLKVINGGI